MQCRDSQKNTFTLYREISNMNEIKLLGISGKKQSGKNTSANYIVGLFLKSLKITKNFSIDNSGRLIITDIFGNTTYNGILDINSRNPNFLEFAEENIFPFVKIYSFADILKRSVCIDILGLTEEQCFGSDEQKNSLTSLLWEDMPRIYDNKKRYDLVIQSSPDLAELTISGQGADIILYHKPGPMTAREVMQYVGTEIFRKMYNNVWVEATIKQIQKDAPSMAIISDVRFPNEVEGILSSDIPNNIIRFTRNPNKNKDVHDSEIALDNYNFNKCIIIDNKDMTIDQQNNNIHVLLKELSWLPYEIPARILQGAINE